MAVFVFISAHICPFVHRGWGAYVFPVVHHFCCYVLKGLIESSALYFNLILLFAALSFTGSCALLTVTIFYVLKTSCIPGLVNPGLTYPGDNHLLQPHSLTANPRFYETG